MPETRDRFISVADSAVDAIILADSAGDIVFFNAAARTMFGYEDSEVLGHPIAMLMPERYREGHGKGLERFVSTGESRVIGPLRRVGRTTQGRYRIPTRALPRNLERGGRSLLQWDNPGHHRAQTE